MRAMSTSKEKADAIAKEMGNRLRRAREAKGWSQAELAKYASVGGRRVGQTGIGNFESGVRRIRHENAFTFERLFGTPAGYFLVVLNEEEAAMVSALRAHRGSPSSENPPNRKK